MVELISVIPELLAGLHLCQYGLVDMRQREDWNLPDLEGQLKGLDHDMEQEVIVYRCIIRKLSVWMSILGFVW